MKGKLLSKEDILRMDGKYVYIIPTSNKVKLSEGRVLIEFWGDRICLSDDKFVFETLIDNINNCFFKVYEWLEEPESEQTITKTEKETNTYTKTYKGSEILEMIENCVLKDEDIIIANGDEEFTVKDILDDKVASGYFIVCLFAIKQKPVDFMTAVNSGKYIRPVSLNRQVDFQSYRYWIDFLVTYKSWLKDPLDLINGLWEIEN